MFNTPGYNKRRLTRDTNKQIDSSNSLFTLKKEETKKGSLPPFSLTKPSNEEFTKPSQDDPLKKFWKKPEESTSKVLKSIDFLQRLSGNVRDDDSKNKPKDKFVISEFKSKLDTQKESPRITNEKLSESKLEIVPLKNEISADKPELSKVLDLNIEQNSNDRLFNKDNDSEVKDDLLTKPDSSINTTKVDKKK